MVPGYLLALREGFEATLIITIVLGTLGKMNRLDLRPKVILGIFAALGVSIAIAAGLDVVGAEFEGQGEMIFEGISMFVAAGLLSWMIFWVGRQNRSMKQHLENGIRKAILTTGGTAIFLLAFVSVLREGTELAVFLFAARLAAGLLPSVIGAVLGLVSAALIGWVLLRSTHRLNLRRFFQITNLLLMFFAAGLVVHGVREFINAGWLQVGVSHLWDISFFLSNQSIPGQVLSALFGYDSAPSLVEVVAYCGYFLFLGSALRLLPNRQRSSVRIGSD